MVSDEERILLAEFLSALKEADLYSLSNTVTGGKISPKDKNDALECILLHSDSAETVLKRKKITKDFLFNYLHAKKVCVLVSDEKPRLIQYILQLWNGSKNLPHQVISDNEGESPQIHITHNKTVINYMPQQSIQPNVSLPQPLTQNVCTPNNEQCLELDEQTVNMLALKFTEWYYNLLNKNFKGGLIAINSEHFWNDADFILRIKLKSSMNRGNIDVHDSSVIDEEYVTGIDNIILLLNKIKDKYQVYFSPNLCSDGVKGKSDRHGGALVLACGTLHKDVGHMCGAFEQIFLIFRDPLTKDNWKIKKTELHLISVDNNSTLTLPTINDTCLKACLT